MEQPIQTGKIANYIASIFEVMKRISKNAGGDTDTTHDYEYTDWGKVSQFAKQFSELLGEIKTTFIHREPPSPVL